MLSVRTVPSSGPSTSRSAHQNIHTRQAPHHVREQMCEACGTYCSCVLHNTRTTAQLRRVRPSVALSRSTDEQFSPHNTPTPDGGSTLAFNRSSNVANLNMSPALTGPHSPSIVSVFLLPDLTQQQTVPLGGGERYLAGYTAKETHRRKRSPS